MDLSRADSFVEVAHALLGAAVAKLGAAGGVVEAIDPTGRPTTCVGSEWIGPEWPRRHLDGGHRRDPFLPRLRVDHTPLATADFLSAEEARELATAFAAPEDLYRHGVIGPLVGEASLIGALRLGWPRSPSPRALVEIAVLCAHASVRLARIGYPAVAQPALARLTARQLEVAALVARGYTNAEVASALAITCDAVKKHVRHLLAALEVANRTELAALVVRTAPTLETGDSITPPGVHVTRQPAPAILRRQ